MLEEDGLVDLVGLLELAGADEQVAEVGSPSCGSYVAVIFKLVAPDGPLRWKVADCANASTVEMVAGAEPPVRVRFATAANISVSVDAVGWTPGAAALVS